MKNDADKVFDTMFERNESTGQSKVARDAEAFLASIGKGSKKITNSLEEDIKKMNSEMASLERAERDAKKNIAKMNKLLEKDGLTDEMKISGEDKKAKNQEEKPEINKAFSQLEEEVKKTLIGQDEFLHKLSLAFKRPHVMGSQENKPFSSIIVSGKTGTGRHTAINLIAENLSKVNYLKGEKPVYINLALYPTSSDSKLFIQDFFAAVQSTAGVIVLENYEKCHKSLYTILADVVLTGKVQLGARYANQKGMLIDVGSALVPNAISNISCEDRYIVFLTTKKDTEFVDSFGSGFVNAIDDVCVTGTFSAQSLREISAKIINELKEKTQKVLAFEIEFEQDLDIYFSSKFSIAQGVNSIEDYSLKCYKELSEYKLETSHSKASCKAYLDDGVLKFEFNDTTLSVENQYEDSAGVIEVKAKMDDIIGLKPVKDYILSLEENYKVQKMRSNLGLKMESPSMHMIFTGNPGTGKTTIARIVSKYLKAMGVLSGGQLIEVSRSDLVGKYVGHTAPLTMQVIESAIGGVLFIDEAYSLYRYSDDSFGLEAIDTLVKGMEDNRDNLLVILAGYTNEMKSFLESNSGLESRFPNVIEFPDYTGEELWEISLSIAKGKGYKVDESVKDKLISYYNKKQEESMKTSGNGRMARNVIEDAVLKQSQRLIKDNSDEYELLLDTDFEVE